MILACSSATCAASIQQAQTIDEAPKESTEYYSAKVAASSHLHAQAKYVGHAQAFYAGMPYGGSMRTAMPFRMFRMPRALSLSVAALRMQ